MIRRMLLLIGGILTLSGPAIGAQPGTPEAAGFTQLFISPCGEPYRGRPGDAYPVVLWFKQADLNHDGKVDLTEFRADHGGFFDALDSDGNGLIEGAEISFYENRFLPDVYHRQHELSALAPPARLVLVQGLGAYGQEPSLGEGAQGPPPSLGARRNAPRQYVGAAAYGLLAEPEPLTAADANLDGRITKAEFLAAADRRFKQLDRRGDGQLTLDEFPMTAAQAAAVRSRR